jgi:hypothetical protein
MKTRKARRAVPLPLMMAELTLASWETIARRLWMMAQGTCGAAEYQRMLAEKMMAAQLSSRALLRASPDASRVLAPWHRGAKANAKRLRRKT